MSTSAVLQVSVKMGRCRGSRGRAPGGGRPTEVEKTMIEVQRSTIVQETRSAFQNAMQHKFIAEVERLAGREVIAFISNTHVGPDVEIELFMLAPLP